MRCKCAWPGRMARRHLQGKKLPPRREGDHDRGTLAHACAGARGSGGSDRSLSGAELQTEPARSHYPRAIRLRRSPIPEQCSTDESWHPNDHYTPLSILYSPPLYSAFFVASTGFHSFTPLTYRAGRDERASQAGLRACLASSAGPSYIRQALLRFAFSGKVKKIRILSRREAQ